MHELYLHSYIGSVTSVFYITQNTNTNNKSPPDLPQDKQSYLLVHVSLCGFNYAKIIGIVVNCLLVEVMVVVIVS